MFKAPQFFLLCNVKVIRTSHGIALTWKARYKSDVV